MCPAPLENSITLEKKALAFPGSTSPTAQAYVLTWQHSPSGLWDLNLLRQWEELIYRLEDEVALESLPVILRSKDDFFCRGLDLKHFWEGTPNVQQFHKLEKIINTLEKLSCLTISVITGDCWGAGMDLALACDLRVITPQATMAFNEVALGFCPGMSTWRLPKFVGLGHARELTLTGRILKAEEILQMGLANRLTCEPDSALSDLLAATPRSSVAVGVCKRLLNEAYAVQQENAIGSYLAGQARCLNNI